MKIWPTEWEYRTNRDILLNIEKIVMAADDERLKKLAEQLRKPTASLEAAVKANQPKKKGT
jgi:hypothetical protein